MGGRWRLLALLFAMLAMKDGSLRGKMSRSPSLTQPYNVPCSKSMNTDERPWWEAKKRQTHQKRDR